MEELDDFSEESRISGKM